MIFTKDTNDNETRFTQRSIKKTRIKKYYNYISWSQSLTLVLVNIFSTPRALMCY